MSVRAGLTGVLILWGVVLGGGGLAVLVAWLGARLYHLLGVDLFFGGLIALFLSGFGYFLGNVFNWWERKP